MSAPRTDLAEGPDTQTGEAATAEAGLVMCDEPRPRLRRIVLNQPAKRNALSPDLREALLAALHEAGRDADVRVIILSGSNGHFCAGGDLASLSGVEAGEMRQRIAAGHAVVRAIATCGKPVVAAVEGYAMGAGAGLALAADVILMGAGARIGFPFVKVGLGPDFGVSHFLPRRVGAARAQRLLMRGEAVGGAAAMAYGLADELAEDGQVAERAVEIGSEFLALPAATLGLIKAQFSKSEALAMQAAFDCEIAQQALSIVGPAFREGSDAFLQKRRANFANL
ncbi:enoyl-CoA hydratase/isomerase family protein [Pseudohoeflea coraliihabitans]|uniref:Enoyl-CoA hydratase/isomerase family protein n=1 Tax=Pseudohoeflea coraliihabitans TaxID=2860393 RepID=A0ABS6WKZ4_9HYPH|nr:enoyl-CoA hydratase-related protein [Pseudohoeflea sp. DP4N28-3]MBW3095805.1 enoyl-CoA hydratase/isomerase family protein [Pseudohoeflea sp. DP4N28-3]